jgi:hypothetical protein
MEMNSKIAYDKLAHLEVKRYLKGGRVGNPYVIFSP